MNANPIAVIADIHGNVWALDAVLADIRRRQIDLILNLGDHLWGSLEPAGVMARITQPGFINICGNQDRQVGETSAAGRTSADHQLIVGSLAQPQLAWLAALPKTTVVGDVFLCHGTPDSDETYLLEEVTPHGVFLKAHEQIAALVQGITEPVIVCGHSHITRTVWLTDGRLIVNPGSVGIPAYDHDVPYFHVMEAGSPHARYAILTKSAYGWSVEHVALAYDWRTPANLARQRGRADRARWLETGRV